MNGLNLIPNVMLKKYVKFVAVAVKKNVGCVIVVTASGGKMRNCKNKKCKAYNKQYEHHCKINNWTFGIGFCQQYMYSFNNIPKKRENK